MQVHAAAAAAAAGLETEDFHSNVDISDTGR